MIGSKVEVICLNTGERHYVAPGLTLGEFAKEFGITLTHPLLGAMVNNRLRDLNFRVLMPVTVEFIDITHSAGIRMYVSSLFFLIQKAVRDEMPSCRLRVSHSVSRGYYCEIAGYDQPIEYPLIFRIVERMRQLVARDVPFESRTVTLQDAVAIFASQADPEKVQLLESRPRLYTTLYGLDGIWDYFFEPLVPSTGYLEVFDVVKYYEGMLLMVPQQRAPHVIEELVVQNKMFEIFREYQDWVGVLGIQDAGTINRKVIDGRAGELIKVSEALHEKKVAQIADMVKAREHPVRLVLIAGPSSSGKTTFSKRLAVQLQVAGMHPHTISLDNYFVDRENTPKDEQGEFDFEALGALDVAKFNDDLLDLLAGKRVELPKFSFELGQRFYDGTFLELEPNGVLVIEGIHGLNPNLTPRIPKESKFRIYISALTSISLDGRSRIPSSDNRLLRRLIRDARYRNYGAIPTIRRWESVRRGEEKNIFPYQEEADVMFNSALPYEFGVLTRYAEPILNEVPNSVPEYSEAVRLLRFLRMFSPIPEEGIPPTSILREFLGGSSFSYR